MLFVAFELELHTYLIPNVCKVIKVAFGFTFFKCFLALLTYLSSFEKKSVAFG